jgi:hypothetical protein
MPNPNPIAAGAGAAARQTCFIDMPFGRKVDPKSGVTIDFDQVYDSGIRPAVEGAGLQCIRGDREQTGGLIHTAMFARLLLAEFVVADMTTANPNVFYELGVRHAAKGYTTIPIFATLGAPPFDVNGVRAIPYELTDGRLDEAAAATLVAALAARLQHALKGPVTADSPLFQLFERYPGVRMSEAVADVFRDRAGHAVEFRNRLAAARALRPQAAALAALKAIEHDLGDIAASERGVVGDLLLSYRAVEAYDAMIELHERMSGDLQAAAMTQQQLAFALNRRRRGGDRERAIALLDALRHSHGDSAETLGLLGRVYKDLWQEARRQGDFAADGWLEQAIEAYTRGFEAEPMDYFPGINALTLLLQKGDDAALAEHRRLLPLVTFATVRKGGEKAADYWTVATTIELACHDRNHALALRCLPRAAALAQKAGETWMLKSTLDNLKVIAACFGAEAGAPVAALAGRFADAIAQLER